MVMEHPFDCGADDLCSWYPLNLDGVMAMDLVSSSNVDGFHYRNQSPETIDLQLIIFK